MCAVICSVINCDRVSVQLDERGYRRCEVHKLIRPSVDRATTDRRDHVRPLDSPIWTDLVRANNLNGMLRAQLAMQDERIRELLLLNEGLRDTIRLMAKEK